MRSRIVARSCGLGLGALVAVTGIGVTEAAAKCTRLAFSVNDYGKVGPTKDAKALLDKYIASWTAERGIKSYRTGKKSVSCELFLDFGFFDEYTCRAEASVCWGDAPAKAKSPAAAGISGAGKGADKPAAVTPGAQQAG